MKVILYILLILLILVTVYLIISIIKLKIIIKGHGEGIFGGDNQGVPFNTVCYVDIPSGFNTRLELIEYYDPITKKNEQWNLKTNSYKSMKSNAQIKTVTYSMNPTNISRLTVLLAKNMKKESSDYINGRFTNINATNRLWLVMEWIRTKYDDEIYDMIDKKYFFYDELNRDVFQSVSNIRPLMIYMQQNNITFNHYLDIGTNWGGLAFNTAKHLGIPIENVTVTEVDPKFKHDNLKYLYTDSKVFKKLELEDNSQDLITAFMVFHHFSNFFFKV